MKFIVLVSLLWVCLSVGICRETSSVNSNVEVLHTVWNYVNESYYDSEFGGNDWEAIREKYEALLPESADNRALRDLLAAMLNELGESHFSIVSGSYKAGEERKGWQGGYAGLDLTRVDDSLVVYRVFENGPAWEAGIRLGDRVDSVNGHRLLETERELHESGIPKYLVAYMAGQGIIDEFQGPAGKRIEVLITKPDGEIAQCELELLEYEGLVVPPFGNLGEVPLALELSELSNGVAYLRYSLWFPVVMNDIRTFIGSLGKETAGLIIDLRGNAGGLAAMSGGVAGMLVDEELSLGRTTLRSGHINFVGFPQRGAYLGPVAILVDGFSCSTSEIFAIGMQEFGRAKIFGQNTPGAALPSVFTQLPNGDLLQSVMGDFKTAKGETLEAIGVEPDFKIQISPFELASGKDSIVEAASDWIINLNSGNHEN